MWFQWYFGPTNFNPAGLVWATIETMTSTSIAPATKETPQFEHDCECCHFLGRHVDPESQQPMDLYAHTTGPMPSVIARTGIDGDYMSGMSFSYGRIAPLTEARRRATASGLLAYNLHEALAYATPEDADTYAEVKAAIALSPEWNAFLAFEAKDVEASQAQFNALIDVAYTKTKRHDDSATRLAACFTVTQRLDKMMQIMRGYDPLQSMVASQVATDFVWKAQTPPMANPFLAGA